MTWIKICGIQESDHIEWVEHSGADAVGFVFTKSKRQVSPEQVRKMLSDKPTSLAKVGVFVNEDPSKINEIAHFCNLDFVQLHGEENEEIIKMIQRPVIKAIRVKNENDITALSAYHQCYALLLDTYVMGERGGTGKSFDWKLAKKPILTEKSSSLVG
ncbi:MAG: phosphoribosylanthranilate isomerase [Bdellovibrionota bacterium]